MGAADATVHPALAFYKAFGGSFDDVAQSVAVDSAGNAYVAGYTSSQDFPVKNGFQSKLGGVRLRSSTDGGKTWSSIDIPAAVLSVAGSASQPAVLYAGTSGGVYKSTDSARVGRGSRHRRWRSCGRS
jgi:hypothetical protein